MQETACNIADWGWFCFFPSLCVTERNNASALLNTYQCFVHWAPHLTSSYHSTVNFHLLSFLTLWSHFCFLSYGSWESRWKLLLSWSHQIFPPFTTFFLTLFDFHLFHIWKKPVKLFLNSNNREDRSWNLTFVITGMDESWMYISFFFQVTFFQTDFNIIIKLVYESLHFHELITTIRGVIKTLLLLCHCKKAWAVKRPRNRFVS